MADSHPLQVNPACEPSPETVSMRPAIPDEDGLERRRHLLRAALASTELQRAIQVTLALARRESTRWDEQLTHVEALLSEVAARALEKEHVARFDPDRKSPIPWLMGFATNLLREHRRFARRERQQWVPQHALGEENWRGILDRLVSLAPAEESNAEEAVRQALEGLNSEQRKVLELRFLQEMPWPEVATKLGISQGAARVRGYRALRALRDRFYPQQRREG